MDLKLFTQTGMFPGVDRKITTSLPNQSRSESAVAINPLNTANMIAVSKKFIDPALYHFTVEPMVTKDGGFYVVSIAAAGSAGRGRLHRPRRRLRS